MFFIFIIFFSSVSSFYLDDKLIFCMITTPECNFEPETERVGERPCPCNLPYLNLSLIEEDNRIELVCRDKTNLTIKRVIGDSSIVIQRLFLIQSSDDVDNLRPLLFTNRTLITVTNLDPHLEYRFHSLDDGISTSNSVSASQWLSPLYLSAGRPPEPVVNVSVTKWIRSGDQISAEIQWTPSPDRFCIYDFYWNSDFAPNKIEVRKVVDLFEIFINGLEYDNSYDLYVIALYEEENIIVESGHYNYVIETPSCYTLNNNSIDICAPCALNNLSAQENLMKLIGNNSKLFNIEVSWDVPEVLPSEVIVGFTADGGEVNETLRVSGNVSWVLFTDVKIRQYYIVTVQAITPGGYGPIKKYWNDVTNFTVDNTPASIGMIPIPALLALCVCVAVATMYITRIRKSRLRESAEHAKIVESLVMTTIVNQPEEVEGLFLERHQVLSRNDISLQEVLGQGAFGVVHKGFLTKGDYVETVAIKTLKNKLCSGIEEKSQFVQEIQMLQSLGKHPHIVSMIGCAKENITEHLYLVVEYCELGDLQHYLQKTFYAIIERGAQDPTISNKFKISPDPGNKGAMVNLLYEALSSGGKGHDLEYFSTADLVEFGAQIADGMVFLANNRIIHRDLAARNVLVTATKRLKISDFGLSRDVYESDHYIKTTMGKLPWKWMAVECLLHQTYTTQSDVWSFGVLLWEIMTFGSTPYFNVAARQLTEMLVAGHRLPRPENATDELYNLMLSCWLLTANDRPRFPELRENLRRLSK